MAILFCDGCDSYAATADLPKKWRTAETPWVWSSSAGRNGGGAIQAATTSAKVITPVTAGFTTNSIVCFAFWLKVSAAPAANALFVTAIQSTGTARASLGITPTGKLCLGANGSVASPQATGAITVTDNNWHWVEWYASNGNSVTNKCYVDGFTEWNGIFTTASPGAVAVDSFSVLSVLNITITIDDFIAYDDSAGAPLTSALPLGPRQITTVRPQADSVVAFTTVTGGATHWDQVDETNADSDTTYVESSGSGDQDLYDFAAMGISPVTITAVVANAFVENPNPGVINFKQVAKSVATTTDGTSMQAPSSYTIRQQPFPLDPNTAAAWASASAVDSATFGIKVV